jgi:predicted nucleotidyltransferase
VTNSRQPLDELQTKLGVHWEALERARTRSAEAKKQLTEILRDQDSEATSIVSYGSLARGEWSSESDLDWSLLVDGGVDPQHLESAHRIGELVTAHGFREPGPTGAFGTVSFSHDLVHKIGGQEDTNDNTTRRVLLLLESITLGRSSAYGRVRRNILHRYVEDDRGLRYGSAEFVPRVLLNDVVRYWRTMAVDFAQKQRARQMEGWALRNTKLRMSRKLLFTSGLLICLQCAIDPAAEAARQAVRNGSGTAALLGYLEDRMAATPLNVLAGAVLSLCVPTSVAKLLFGSYDRFLALLEDAGKRQYLKGLRPEAFGKDEVFRMARDISHEFQEGLIQLFFKSHDDLSKLTMKYGVF